MSILDSKVIWTLWFLAGRCWKDRSSPCNQRALAKRMLCTMWCIWFDQNISLSTHINTFIVLLCSNLLIQNPFARFRQVLQGVAHCHRTLAAIALDQGVVAVTGQIISPRMGITSLSSQVEFRISRSRIYAPRPQASEYPRGWRTVQDHRLRIGPTFSALAHWILSSKTPVVQYSTSHSRQTLMSHFHLICTSHCLTCLQGVDQSPSLWWLYGIVRQSWSWWTDDNACPPPQFFVVVFFLPFGIIVLLKTILFDLDLMFHDVPWQSFSKVWTRCWHLVLGLHPCRDGHKSSSFSRRLWNRHAAWTVRLGVKGVENAPAISADAFQNHPKSLFFASCGLLCTNCCIFQLSMNFIAISTSATFDSPWFNVDQHSIRFTWTLPSSGCSKFFSWKGRQP